jgi:ATP/ADP translocase
MFAKFFRTLWGDLTREEYVKFFVLGLAIMLILGNYWMLRTTKDPLFNQLVGFKTWQPVAKWFSLFVMIFVVLIYSKLIDLFKREKLVYFMCALYSGAFILMSYLIAHVDVITISETSFLYPAVAWIPGRAIGWIAYVVLESYG